MVASHKEQRVTVTLVPKMLTVDGHDYEITFIEDPDGYKIEILPRATMEARRSHSIDDTLITLRYTHTP